MTNCFVSESLTAGLALGRRRADRERQLGRLDDPLEEQRPLGRLELLRVLLGVGQRAQLGLELLADRALDGLETQRLEQRVQALAHLHLPGDVLLAGVHRQLGGELGEDLLDDGGRLAEAVLADRGADPVAVRALELLGQRHVEPLRLADLLGQVDLHLAELLDLAVGELERLEEDVLGDLLRAGLDHRQAVHRADDDQVERALARGVRQRRVDDQRAVDPADAHGADRAEERQRRDHQRGRGPVDAQDVVRA